MEIIANLVENKLHFELTISREEFNHLCAGAPEMPCIAGRSAGGFEFYVFNNPHGEISESFRPIYMGGGDGYAAAVGAPVPLIPPNVTAEEFDKLSHQATENLEKAINDSPLIPIQGRHTELGPTILGYVKMHIAKYSA